MIEGKDTGLARGYVVGPHIPQKIRDIVKSRDGDQCRYCGDTSGPFDLDHVIPRSRGGLSTEINLIVSCSRCNRRKKDRTPEEMGWVIDDVPGNLPKIGPRDETCDKGDQEPDWLSYATEEERLEVAKMERSLSRILEAKAFARGIKDSIMMRCIRRMRRDLGKE